MKDPFGVYEVSKGLPRALKTMWSTGSSFTNKEAQVYQSKKYKKRIRGLIREEKIARQRKYVPEESISGLPKGTTF